MITVITYNVYWLNCNTDDFLDFFEIIRKSTGCGDFDGIDNNGDSLSSKFDIHLRHKGIKTVGRTVALINEVLKKLQKDNVFFDSEFYDYDNIESQKGQSVTYQLLQSLSQKMN